ncbi:M6 family metalloprotease domain-containing protein [Pseudonocardia sp. RS11V-5]|uniref:M6 family metalloprotease domain-containing protein n=1 Tax=Pseudonocardia terrae TaxID=2905831 RepID=UPI001E4F27D5|nr:M6 family metalloprotease domain-containing protein [Pseudonocardia terrae]MCE3555739.1 M6 family metalloprotease domain-containing protein [Pseudonocardia terrae]
MPVPYGGELVTLFNPDGTEVQARAWGNQFAAVLESLDGYTLVQDPETGFFHYATVATDKQDLLPEGPRFDTVDPAELDLPKHLRVRPEAVAETVNANRGQDEDRPRWEIRRAERRARLTVGRPGPAPAPPSAHTVGNYVGLCLLVQFPDVQGTITKDQVEAFCNESGYTEFGNNGSVRDYFTEVSGGKLTYQNVVTAYYTAKRDRAYYTDETVPQPVRARELITEALDHLVADGFDFSTLTTDDADFVRALNVFYAGPRVNNWAKGLWPHSWHLDASYPAAPDKLIYDYQITNMGSRLTLRTFCHENGHVICDYPDLYDYGSEGNGIGNYCLMCGGGSDVNPVHVNAYLKNASGWASSLSPIEPGTTLAVQAGTNEFLIKRRNATEYFIVENRQRSGRDSALPDEGLVIWHVDELGSNDNEQMTPAQHYECSLEQADNHFDLEHAANMGDTSDLYGAPFATAFGSTSAPNSRWWDGQKSGLEIDSISAPGPKITITTTASP